MTEKVPKGVQLQQSDSNQFGDKHIGPTQVHGDLAAHNTRFAPSACCLICSSPGGFLGGRSVDTDRLHEAPSPPCRTVSQAGAV
jgi:hypothetical protein